MSDPRSRTIVIGVGIAILLGGVLVAWGVFGGAGHDHLLALTNPTPEEIEQIAMLLSANDVIVRRRANAKLLEIGEAAVPSLQNVAGGENPEARMAAFVIVSQISPETTLDMIEGMLDSPDRAARGRGLKLLQNVPFSERKLDLYIKSLSDEDPEMRTAGVEWLGNFRGKKVENALKQAMKDPDPEVQSQARNAFQRATGGRMPSSGGRR